LIPVLAAFPPLRRRRGIEVIERRIMPDELNGFTECFARQRRSAVR
jgi:hypothetical protein